MIDRDQRTTASQDLSAAAGETGNDPEAGWRGALGIPTIRDRMVQKATKLVVEPIFEADLEPNAHGCRPKRSAVDAMQQVHQLLKQGYTDVVDADLS